jgi:hypothetical protein
MAVWTKPTGINGGGGQDTSNLLPDMPVWPDRDTMDFSNSLATVTKDASSDEVDYIVGTLLTV